MALVIGAFEVQQKDLIEIENVDSCTKFGYLNMQLNRTPNLLCRASIM